MRVPSSAPFLRGDTFRPNPDVSKGVRLLPSWTDQAKLFFNIYREYNDIFFSSNKWKLVSQNNNNKKKW